MKCEENLVEIEFGDFVRNFLPMSFGHVVTDSPVR